MFYVKLKIIIESLDLKKNTVCKHQLEMIEKFSSHIIKEDEQIIWAQIPFLWSMNMSLNSIFSFTNNLF